MNFMDPFDTLYIPCHEALFRTALYCAPSYDAAEEILQQTVLNAIEHFSQLRETAFFKTWITRILLNNVRQYYRRAKAITSTPLETDIPCGDHSDRMLDALAVRGAIQTLKEPYRRVIVLRYFSDMTIREISQTLRIPQSTVKSRLYRALDALKQQLVEKEESPYENERV